MSIGNEKLTDLIPSFRKKVVDLISDMESKGWRIRIVWGRRSPSENAALVRAKVASKNSKHLLGKAVDLIDRSVGYSEDRNHPFYKDLEAASNKYGVRWGGDFSTRWDPCHIEDF